MTDALDDLASEICRQRGLALEEASGQGAFKKTYLVRTEEGEPRALKVYKEAARSERTERELRAMARCDHPRIARVDLVGSHRLGEYERLYTIEEFLAGGSLAEAWETGTMPVPELRELGRDLGSALAHLREQALVHRDVKPENVMYRSERDDPVLVDLGLVRDLAQTSITATWALRGPGTPFYAAPEQLVNDKYLIDWRTDQFSLGVTLAMCGLGQHPFARHGDTPEDVVERVARREAPADTFRTWLDEKGLGLLATMVAPWPVNRFSTPKQMLELMSC